MCVAFPIAFRRLARFRHGRLLFAMFLAALILQSSIPVLREVRSFALEYTGDRRCLLQYHLGVRVLFGREWLSEYYQRAYFWTHALTVIAIPIATMLVSSIIVALKFRDRDLGEAMSARRKTVVRLTFSTTISHLVLEGPGLLVVVAAATSSSKETFTAGCLIPSITNLLTVVNAAIPFYLYIWLSAQFRGLAGSVCRCGADPKPSTAPAYSLTEKDFSRCDPTSRRRSEMTMRSSLIRTRRGSTPTHVTGLLSPGDPSPPDGDEWC